MSGGTRPDAGFIRLWQLYRRLYRQLQKAVEKSAQPILQEWLPICGETMRAGTIS
jgi:hypothetical protein